MEAENNFLLIRPFILVSAFGYDISFQYLSSKMLSSVVYSVLFAGLAVASVICPIKPYDARPGYQIACVAGDQDGVYENSLVQDIDVQGTMFDATLPFECVRQVGG